jgi:hypothetical protein
MSFPASPTVGQQATVGGRLYQWTGTVWDLVATVTGHASQHAANGSDPLTITSSQVSDFSSAVEAASPAPIHPFLLMGG